MRIGYARVSTEDQCLDLQHRALADARCDLVYEDKLSGVRKDRKGLSKALKRCGPRDVLIVRKLDRLGRSLFDPVRTAEALHARGAGLKILTGQGAVIDTTTAEGRLMFGILATMADFERELIRDRTKAGMAAYTKSAYDRRSQDLRMWMAGGIGLFAGVLLVLLLPRILPFAADTHVAAIVIGSDRVSAGRAMIQADDPEGWRNMVAASQLVRDNVEALGRCAEAARAASEDQLCTITVKAPAQ
ncbi:MAG: DUF6118 family protein [Rhizobiaceae bacterium]